MKRIDHYRESVFNASKSELGAIEKLLLVAMAKWMDNDTLGNCRPGWTALMRRTSLSEKTVERTLASVIRKGWLAQDHRGGSRRGGRREASIYRGVIPDHRHRDGSQNYTTTVRESEDHRHRDGPPSNRPRRPSRAAGKVVALTPCGDLPDGIVCDGRWHTDAAGQATPCPQTRSA